MSEWTDDALIGQNGRDHRRLTAARIEALLVEQIQRGCYDAGARLPSVRALSRQLGVNKNTVVRAYQALERRGYIELARGRGAFVQRQDGAGDDDAWRAAIDRLIDDAKRRWGSREAVLRELTSSVDRVFGASGVRVAFVECNVDDVETMRGELSAAVEQALEGVLLADVLAQPQEIAHRFDFVVTTFYHLSEINQALGSLMPERVIGIQATLPHDALLNIARLHVPVIGVVADMPSAREQIARIIHACHPSATVLPLDAVDLAQSRALIGKTDAIVVTRSCQRRLLALVEDLKLQIPIITVTFTIDQQSIEYVRKRLRDLAVLC